MCGIEKSFGSKMFKTRIILQKKLKKDMVYIKNKKKRS